jgi:hypothetical protein
VLVVTNQLGTKVRELEVVMAIAPEKLYIIPEERLEIIKKIHTISTLSNPYMYPMFTQQI